MAASEAERFVAAINRIVCAPGWSAEAQEGPERFLEPDASSWTIAGPVMEILRRPGVSVVRDEGDGEPWLDVVAEALDLEVIQSTPQISSRMPAHIPAEQAVRIVATEARRAFGFLAMRNCLFLDGRPLEAWERNRGDLELM